MAKPLKMCRMVLAGRKCLTKDCNYAHSEDDLPLCRYGSECRYKDTDCGFHHPKEPKEAVSLSAFMPQIEVLAQEASNQAWDTHEKFALLLHSYISKQVNRCIGVTQLGDFYTTFKIDKDFLPR